MSVESGARASKTLSGDLRSRPLAVLLAGACERGTSGTFTFRHGRRKHTLTLRGGRIAGVHTHEPVAYLGAVLHELGAIDLATLDATLQDVTEKQRLHGEVLIERGALVPQRLDEGLAEQTFRNVEYLFTLPEEATWAFRDDVDGLADARDDGRPEIDTWVAIWRGLRERPIAEHVQRTLVKIDGGIHLRDLGAVVRFGLAPEERAVCERLAAQPMTLEQIILASPLTAERTTLLVYLLALARCVVRVETQPIGPVDLGVDGIRERARRIDNEDPYATLGLRAGATTEAARAAYFRLARLWHPEKLPPALAEVRAECEHVFARLGAAHRALSPNLSVPPAAIASMRPGAASVAPPAGAPPSPRPTMLDVDAALARGDLKTAETHARTLTTAGAEGPTARAVLVWCGIGGGTFTDPEGLELAFGMLDRILTGDPDCARALFYRGQINKRLGRPEAASRDFRKVVRLQPHNLDAQREIRLYSVPPPKAAAELTPGHGAPSEAPPAPSTSGEEAATPVDASFASGLRRLLEHVVGK